MGKREILDFLTKNKGKFFTVADIMDHFEGKLSAQIAFRSLKQLSKSNDCEAKLANVEYTVIRLTTLYRVRK